MLLTLMVRNVASFYDETVLDLQQRSFKRNVPTDGDWASSTHRLAGLFGANASGKSNLLHVFTLLKNAAVFSPPWMLKTQQLHFPHTLHADEPSIYEVEYVSEGMRFRWSLEVGPEGVVGEDLDINTTGRWKRVFSRDQNGVSFGPNSAVPRAARENIREFAVPETTTLAAGTLVPKSGHYLEAAADWWSTQVTVPSPGSEIPTEVQDLPALLQAADIGIEACHICADDERSLEFTHAAGDRTFVLPEHLESQGTRAWLNLTVEAITVLANGGVLIVDEIDTSLHPHLMRGLIDLFSDEDINTAGAQLIFSSHDATLLGNYPDAALNKDEVWIVDKFDSYSELTQLSLFSDVRGQHNLEQLYISGLYGGVPHVNKYLLKDFLLTPRKQSHPAKAETGLP